MKSDSILEHFSRFCKGLASCLVSTLHLLRISEQLFPFRCESLTLSMLCLRVRLVFLQYFPKLDFKILFLRDHGVEHLLLCLAIAREFIEPHRQGFVL